MTDIPWLWCLASFIFGVTVGAGGLVFIVLAGTPLRQRERESD